MNDSCSNDGDTGIQPDWRSLLAGALEGICAQLDPSGQVFASIDTARRSVLILLACRLAKDIEEQMASTVDSAVFIQNNDTVAHYIMDFQRHARLIGIDITTVSDANVRWLLLTVKNLNSIQLLSIIHAVPAFEQSTVEVVAAATMTKDNYREKQQQRSQIDYNDYQQWLSTLHTVMLHDTIVSQDEYDCLMGLSEQWLGVRQLF
ncbi:hypothetical protein [Psychrobacter sp.]|uniref:hypothetical protein n=1 Tax=Psychrobacter sp. TaxID=56811 RepID=UPI00264A3ECD|nr:hypothetical protein [Psychrobacter sp.]MDN6276624.1 hypothetical protein [Psychrobacter sp.]MDN6307889.1 hypothetical protein [Psychrobacter sp.]